MPARDILGADFLVPPRQPHVFKQQDGSGVGCVEACFGVFVLAHGNFMAPAHQGFVACPDTHDTRF